MNTELDAKAKGKPGDPDGAVPVYQEEIVQDVDEVWLPHLLFEYKSDEGLFLMCYIQMLSGELRGVSTYVSSCGGYLHFQCEWSKILLNAGKMHGRFRDVRGGVQIPQ